ncbi:TPA: hypothetical protein HA265_00070 [Candidatus Woesearchaeota archaeon]|nr:hypothetical protein [Candidatus Woesearchaeota archaeon]
MKLIQIVGLLFAGAVMGCSGRNYEFKNSKERCMRYWNNEPGNPTEEGFCEDKCKRNVYVDSRSHGTRHWNAVLDSERRCTLPIGRLLGDYFSRSEPGFSASQEEEGQVFPQ